MAKATPAAAVAADEVADLFAELGPRLRQIVGGKTQAPEPVIDDACQFAWGCLVHHRQSVRRETALGWLATTAVREAVKLIRRQGREVPLEALTESASLSRLRPLATPTDELVEQRAKLATVAHLPIRQQRLVWLQGLGFSYGEMADREGASMRTVERQLLRAKKALREAA
jgi:DNA-directed RNA polymerase specialized sigma24 family protein